ncbi:hypothetical protein SAMN05216388_1017103 [Halorientalis persicus]|uniref:Uncharacterized protein n=1 Tax=Halorientalis persicus TaxID=1367881 RepID=A0A1H8S109_9EURY|nr:hypothetical protein [Halorientalis persicus]SEO72134.1 hypothetical protein SAMN05216388_1017103 [Halorientalis persicus]
MPDDHQTRTLTYRAAPIQWTNWTLPEDAQTILSAALRDVGGSVSHDWIDGLAGGFVDEKTYQLDGVSYRSFVVTRIGITTYEITLSTDEQIDTSHESRPFRERLSYYLRNVL